MEELTKEASMHAIARHITQSVLQTWRRRPTARLRPKLGDQVHIFDLQSRLASILIFSGGWDAALYTAGGKYGKSTARYITLCPDISRHIREFRKVKDVEGAKKSELFKLLNTFFKMNKSGILNIEKYKGNEIIFTIGESADAYGLPNIGRKICYFICGFLTGFISIVLDKEFYGNETECVAKGDGICRFVLRKVE